MEFMENYTMSPAKRPAESAPIGLEKRIKISDDTDDQVLPFNLLEKLTSGEQDDKLYDIGENEVSDEEVSCCWLNMRPKGPNYVYPDSPKTKTITFETRLFPSPPPPTSEDIKNNRRFCDLCDKYVDHPKLECPTEYFYGGYRITEDGRTEYFRCSICGEKNDHLGQDCPPSPRCYRSADVCYYDEDMC